MNFKENLDQQKNLTLKHTDDSLLKSKSKFFPDKDNNSERNPFFEKLWNITLKEKTTQNNLSQKQRQA